MQLQLPISNPMQKRNGIMTNKVYSLWYAIYGP